MRLDCYNVGAMNLQHRTPRGVPVCVDKPDEGDITLPQLSWIKTYLNGIEGQIYDLGRLDGINAASFADWYLLSELFRNNDAVFFSSVFLWKDTAGAAQPSARLLNLGPLWDFDLSAGNINVYGNWRTEGCWVAKSLAYQPNWLTKLFGYPEFVSLTLERWKAKRPAIEAFVNASIDIHAWRLEAAQQRNFARWPLFGTQGTGYFTFDTYADEVAFLKRFLNERMAWLDAAYASPESFRANCLGDGTIPN
jgi:CotH kinase protein